MSGTDLGGPGRGRGEAVRVAGNLAPWRDGGAMALARALENRGGAPEGISLHTSCAMSDTNNAYGSPFAYARAMPCSVLR
eukprot:3040556-Rhodomonas_salina.2